MPEQRDLVSGIVVSGGDTTPQGLMDAPRRFVFQVATDLRGAVNVVYVAFPPSPISERRREQITLNFHAGSIQIGDYLEARGNYDTETNTLTVAEEGDYIRTFADK